MGRAMDAAPRHPHPVGRRVLRVLAAGTLGALALFLLRDRAPPISQLAAALSAANLGWLALAIAAEGFSIGMFARQQRRLLRAFGVPMSMPRAGAISFSRSAIANSMPAGSALSAGFAFRQFRASGAKAATAATVMIASGVMSTLALCGLYLTGLLATLIGPLTNSRLGLGLGLGVGVALAGAGFGRSRRHRTNPHLGRHLFGAGVATDGWPRLSAALSRVREARDAARQVPRRHWTLALAAAALSWLADLTCLVAVAWAFDLPLNLRELALLYLGVQIVRQVPLTPGGVGLIEASLLAGLVAADAPNAAAAAAVVVYRLLSCWLIILIGAMTWVGVLRHSRPADALPAADAPQPTPADAMPKPAHRLRDEFSSAARRQAPVDKRPLTSAR